MKTAFTLHFHRSQPGLRPLTTRPFVPSYPTPFIADENCHYYGGEGCRLSYKWHDAYDVYIGILEVRTQVALSLPYETLVDDLHLVYQLSGASRFSGTETAQLYPHQKLESYSPPANGWVHFEASEEPAILLTVVPKRTWATRYPPSRNSPMRQVLQSLQEHHPMRVCRPPSSISPAMDIPLHDLLHLPALEEMDLDDALNGPMVQLVKLHKTEGLVQDRELLESAREFAVHLIRNTSTGQKRPTVAGIAQALHTSEKHLWELHRREYGTGMHLFIHDQCLEEAKRLLAEEGLPIAAVAARLDFSALSNFSNQFKRKYGITPRAFIRQLPGDPGNLFNSGIA